MSTSAWAASKLSLRRPGEVHNVLPFVGVGSRDNRDNRILVADIEDFMGNARLDKDEIAGFVFQRMLQRRAILMPHAAREDVEHHFEIHVNVGIRDAARWNGSDIHG
jgi:hypothetical protein